MLIMVWSSSASFLRRWEIFSSLWLVSYTSYTFSASASMLW
jgi:hypothetical protein